ncbi:MAG: NifB/NifX family molybdenum-iron cluster-binding protein [Bacteroidota bacterium]
MKIAVAVKNKKLSSPLEYHFGKAPYFAVIDDNDGSVEFIKNKYEEEPAAKGIMVASFLSEKGVKKIYAGDFGVKVKPTMDVLGIEMNKIDIKNLNITEFIQRIIKT